jgi:hypothetical protein
MSAGSYPALVIVDGVNLALHRLISNTPGQNIGHKDSTVPQLFGPAFAFLSHLRGVDVGETNHADASHLECIAVHRSNRAGNCLCQSQPRYEVANMAIAIPAIIRQFYSKAGPSVR